MSEFLNESELTERRTFIESFVKEIVVVPGDALMRYTVPWDTSRAWATLGARIRARLITLAEPFPARTKCSSWLCSSGVRRTANFSLTTPPPRNNTNFWQIITATQSTATISRPSLIEY